jgi:hypothetical protein
MAGKTNSKSKPKSKTASDSQPDFDREVMVLFAAAIDEGRSALKKGVEERKKREAMDQKNWASFRF